MKRVCLVLPLIAWAGSGFAADSRKIVCKSGGVERSIEVVYEGQQGTLPCKVNYYKSEADGGNKDGLFSAANVEGFCEQKAKELQGKLEGSGFSCDGMQGSADSGTTQKPAAAGTGKTPGGSIPDESTTIED